MGENFFSNIDLMKLPLGATSFTELRKSGRIYVDKTELIFSLTRNISTPIFLSRPRRFGKSLLVSTFESLFKYGIRNFKGLAIEELWQEKRCYNVVHLDFSIYADKNALDFKQGLTSELVNAFSDLGEFPVRDESGEYFFPEEILSRVADIAEGKSIVLLIDEYDAPITHHFNDPEERHKIESIHGSFFAAIKRFEGIFRFVFITGITRVSNVSLFSVFNTLQDITLDDEYATLTGITEEELHRYFDPYVQNAASVLAMDAGNVYEKLKNSYDGFMFALDAKQSVYNPWSLLSFLTKPSKGFQNYWYQSSGGTPTLLVNYLKTQKNLDLFAKIGKGEHVIEISRLTAKSEAGQIPMDLLLLQTGYFTLRHGSSIYAKLVLPNDEVSDFVIALLLDIQNLKVSFDTSVKIDEIPSLADTGDIDAIVKVFNLILSECLSPKSKAFEDENTLRDIIYSKLPDKGLIKSREEPNAAGYSDLELKTSKSRLVIEFKRSYKGMSEKRALEQAVIQMKERRYGEGTDGRKVLKVAMVISSSKKAITRWLVL